MYQAMSNPQLNHGGDEWVVVDSDWQTISRHPDKRSAEQEADQLNATEIDENQTGERISTPRGSFSIVDLTAEQMRAQGYGLHFEHDGYYIMAGHNRAYAIQR
jgi:hypothetical protein